MRKAELKKSVEAHELQINDLRKQAQDAQEAAKAAQQTLESTQKELQRASPFEREVKEKNLLIGKLRHEAVTLNEHLTKALRILKKGRPEDNVDRQIITNYFLHFLAIDRSDPKKFEALQLISALLGWTDGLSLPYYQHPSSILTQLQNKGSKQASPAQAHHLALAACAFPSRPSVARPLPHRSTQQPTPCSWPAAPATRSRWLSSGRTSWSVRLRRARKVKMRVGARVQLVRHRGQLVD